MKISVKRDLVLCLFIFAVVLLFECTAFAASEGFCGDGVTWTLSNNGTLSISGNGDTYNYESQQSPWYDFRNVINEVVIKGDVRSLGTYFLQDCLNLTSIEFEGNLCGFSGNFLSNCPSLTTLVLPENINMWGTPMISQCENLTVYCKKSVHNVFGSLRAGGINFVVTDAESDFITDGTNLIGYIGTDKKVIIPEGITEIGYAACSYLLYAEEVVIPNSVVFFSNMAFEHCQKLITITIPESVKEFGPAVFEGCTSLKTITLPKGITNIPSSTFQDCSALETITIPSSITTISWFAFSGCSSLSKVYYGGSEEYRKLISIGDYNECLINAEWTYGDDEPPIGIQYCGDNVTWNLDREGTLVLKGHGGTHEYKTKKSPWYEIKDEIKRIIIEKDITSLGTYLFEDCSNLVSIEFEGNLCGFSGNFLSNCPSLTTLVLPENIDMWGTPMISQCKNLTVYCKKSVHNVFGSLQAGRINFVVTDAESDFITEGTNLIGYIGTDKKVIIPEGITEIGYAACSYLLYAEEIVLPNTVKRFSNMAFEHCEKLKRMVIPQSVNELGPAVFKGCTNLSSISIPNSITSISSSTFNGCSCLKTITLPASVKSVEWFAFSGCSSLEKVFYEGTEADRERMNISQYNELLENAEWVYGVNFTQIVSIPQKVKIIEDDAFNGCGVSIVDINENCQSIGSNAFANCENLVRIYIPDSVVIIADNFLDGSDHAIIICSEGSTADQWAAKHSWTVIH